MALPAYQSVGTLSTNQTTTVSPGTPASLATGDGVLLLVVTKPDTATINTPSGWTLIANVAGGGGTSGNGTGPTQQAWFFREKDASWSTVPSVTITGGTRSAGAAFRYTKTAGSIWDVSSATGVYGTGGTTTNASTTMGSNPGLVANDAVIGCFTTQASGTTGSAESWTATGVSAWGTVTERADNTIIGATNPGIGSVVFTGSVTTGASTAAPVMNGTMSVATRGTAAMVRLREATATTGSETPSISVADTSARIITYVDNEDSGTTDANKDLGLSLSKTEDSGATDNFTGNLSAAPTPISGTEAPTLSIADASSVSVSQPASQTNSLSIADASTVVVSVSTSDTSAISATDASTPAVQVTTSQTHSLSIADASTPAVSVSTTDIGAVSVSDISNPSLSSPGTESVALSVSDASSVAISISASETSSVSVSETTATTAGITASQTHSLSIADASAAAATVSASETNSLSVADASSVSVNNAVNATETAAVSVSDVSTSSSTLSASESPAVSVSDVSAVAVSQAASDAAAISVAESSSVGIVTAVSASQTHSLSVTDASAVSNPVVGSESPSISVSDSSSVVVSVATSQSHSLSVSDASARTITVTDNDDAGTTDVNKDVGLKVTSTDNSGVFDYFTGTLSSTSPTVFDLLPLAVDDVSDTSISLSRTDTAAISVNDISSSAPAIPGIENISLAVTESATVAIAVTASQSHALLAFAGVARTMTYSDNDDSGTTDANSQVGTGVSRTDDSGASDLMSASTDGIVGRIINNNSGASDIGKIVDQYIQGIGTDDSGSSDSLSVTRAFESTDGGSISVSDASVRAVALSFLDEFDWTVDDEATIVVSVATSDTAAVSVAESTSFASTVTASDSGAVSVSENRNVAPSLPATESTSIAVAESRSIVVTVAGSENTALSITDTSNRSISLSRSESVALSVTDDSQPTVKVTGTDSAAVSTTSSATVNDLTDAIKVYVGVDGEWLLGTFFIYLGGQWYEMEIYYGHGGEWV